MHAARRKGGADPENHCALNVALYGRGGHRWSMTERGRKSISRSLDHFTIGPSAMRWEEGALVIDIDEVTVPIPSRLKGQVRLTPSAICGHEVRLDHAGQHVWRPVAPFSRIEAAFEKPALRWSGVGYHDSNWGEVPLEDSFESWVWSRAAMKDGASIIYDTILRDGIFAGLCAEDRCRWRGGRPAASATRGDEHDLLAHEAAHARGLSVQDGCAAGGFAVLFPHAAPYTDG